MLDAKHETQTDCQHIHSTHLLADGTCYSHEGVTQGCRLREEFNGQARSESLVQLTYFARNLSADVNIVFVSSLHPLLCSRHSFVLDPKGKHQTIMGSVKRLSIYGVSALQPVISSLNCQKVRLAQGALHT